MPRLNALLDYYDEHPPTHIVAAAFAGIKKKGKVKGKKYEDIRNLTAFFPTTTNRKAE